MYAIRSYYDFNKNFAHRTYVLPDVAESLFGSYLGNMLQKCNLFQKGKLVITSYSIHYTKLYD